MPWEIRTNGTDRVLTGLSTAEVSNRLAHGQFTPEDWARNTPGRPWQQLATLDEFEGVVATVSRRRHQAQPEAEGLDMTPMIDVTFLLLIFFMITATFHLQKGMDFPPDKTKDTAEQDQPLPGLADFGDRIIVELSETDEFGISRGGSGPAVHQKLTTEKVTQTLQKEAQSTKKSKVLIVPHELTSHEAVVAVIDAAALAGLADVTLADVTTQRLPTGGGTPQIIRDP